MLSYYIIIIFIGRKYMKLVTIRNSRMLAGVASMLECLGYDTEDRHIALGMEAPYLFLRTEDGFVAGAGLFKPQWINLHLHTIGFHMAQHTLPAAEIPDFLRQRPTALLPLHHPPKDAQLQPMVFTGLSRGRFCLHSLHPTLPQQLTLTAAQLQSRLPEACTLYTVEAIPPEPTDFAPYLGESLRNLALFWKEFQQLLNASVTREEYDALKKSHLRALMHDLLPTASLTQDIMLTTELKIVNYFYAGVFKPQSPERVVLRDKMPPVFAKNCIHWLREDIIDRLYALGASDKQVDEYCRKAKEG